MEQIKRGEKLHTEKCGQDKTNTVYKRINLRRNVEKTKLILYDRSDVQKNVEKAKLRDTVRTYLLIFTYLFIFFSNMNNV